MAAIRPHLRYHVRATDPAAITARLASGFEKNADDLYGRIVGQHVLVAGHIRNLWSPWLDFEIEPKGEDVELVGKFAPHPDGWTLYLAAYAVTGISMLGLAFFGLSQWMAGSAPTMLWSLPVGLGVLGLLYGSAFLGQRFAGKEMRVLERFLVECLDGLEVELLETPTL